MPSKHLVCLDAPTRTDLETRCSCGQHAARLLVHARILLLTDSSPDGPAWTDEKAAEALGCSLATVERVRRRFAVDGLEVALRVRKAVPGRPPKLDGVAEAHLIALACSTPPTGRARWTVRLLHTHFVELVTTRKLFPQPVGRETLRQTLKKTSYSPSA